MTEIVAGGAGEFMTVRHLRVSGSQAVIGRALAEEAKAHHGWQPLPADPTIERARRAWFERHWPQHHARMAGAAEVAGVTLDDHRVHLDALAGVPLGSGCSATWSAEGLMGRNYDFFTVGWETMFALMSGGEGPADEPPAASRPYVVTSTPDDGPAVTFVTMNELDCAMDGINEHGLAVVLLIADAENAGAPVPAGPQVGLSPAQLPRFLLDTCENAEQAKAALLDAKQYDLGVPLHYLIADPSGRAFVWEHAHGGVEHIIEPDGDALCVTNHLLHRPADASRDGEETMFTHDRLARLDKRTKAGPMSPSLLRDALDEVRFTSGAYPLRTLWRTAFDLEKRSMATHFYLGDAAEGEPRYSPELTFRPAR